MNGHSLVQDLVCELYSHRVLGIHLLNNVHKFCDDTADLIVLLVVIPVLYMISPNDLQQLLCNKNVGMPLNLTLSFVLSPKLINVMAVATEIATVPPKPAHG